MKASSSVQCCSSLHPFVCPIDALFLCDVHPSAEGDWRWKMLGKLRSKRQITYSIRISYLNLYDDPHDITLKVSFTQGTPPSNPERDRSQPS